MGSFIIQTCCLTTALMLSEEAFKREREGPGSVTAIGNGKYLCTGKKSIWRNKKDQHHHHHLQILSPSGDENNTSASASVAAACVYYSPVIIPSIDMEKQNISSNQYVYWIYHHISLLK